MRLLENAQYNIIGVRKIGYIVAGVLVAISLLSIIFRGFNLGIDFKGGTEIIVRFEKNVDITSARAAFDDKNTDFEIKEYGAPNELMIRADFDGDLNALQAELENAFTKTFPENPHEILQIESVGPSIAGDLQLSAVYALIGSLVVILLYIGVRFEFKFATMGVVATLFDVLMVAGIFSLFGNVSSFMPLQVDQTIIAAFLTIAGYSINDKVVIFDRIRENLKLRKTETNYEKLFNDSINETVSRTIITGISVLFTLIVLFFFAGPTIRGLAFGTLVGILIGTFSSMFIAAPMVLDWQQKTGGKFKLRG